MSTEIRSMAGQLRGKRATVFGLGRSGLAACDLLHREGAIVTGTDAKPEQAIAEAVSLRKLGVTLELGGHRDETALASDLIVVSPGVNESIAPIARAAAAGVPVISEVELASWFIRGRIVGVTGSNGKTTTTALAAAVLKSAGMEVRVGGNIGQPLASLVAGSSASTVFVIELSSFQLDTTHTLRCDVAILLNITPDHMDRYGTMQAYSASKARIFRNQRPGDVAVLNAEDPSTEALRGSLAARSLLFSSRRRLDRGAWIGPDEEVVTVAPSGTPLLVLKASEVPLLGRHNLENAMAVLLCAWHLGADMDRAASGVRCFAAVPHRLQLVGERDAVRFVNDSKATNLDAVKTALAAVPGPVIIILGGRDKGALWTELPPLLRGRVRLVLTIGEAAATVEAALGDLPMARASSMGDAVRRGRAAAEPGDTVLLSPGCASFDMFRNFEHRGEVFAEEVRACLAS